uniref:Uncharacterized protein n=1 Tax=Laticauda laticaudata TaxID=8630 RepID=A0A8C5RRP0_LATLA
MEPKESLKSTGGEERGKSAHFHPSFRGGASVKTPVSALSASSQSDSKQPVLCDLPKGLGSNVPQPDLSKAVSLSMGLYMGETDTKVMGNELGFPHYNMFMFIILSVKTFNSLKNRLSAARASHCNFTFYSYDNKGEKIKINGYFAI